MNTLGISAFYHDSAACAVVDGLPIAAAQEERFSRRKNDPSFPVSSIDFCLDFSGLSLDQFDEVVFYEVPLKKFGRIASTYLQSAPFGYKTFIQAFREWIPKKLMSRRLICDQLRGCTGVDLDPARLKFVEHHMSHAASAFYPSPFSDSLILTIDGVGEFATTSASVGSENGIDVIRELHWPNSIGMLYSTFAAFCGFRVNSGEYKLMGMAPYGCPKYYGLIVDNLIDMQEDGSFRLNLDYFDFCYGDRMYSDRFIDLFGLVPRALDDPRLSRDYANLAASIQEVVNEIVFRMARELKAVTGQDNLCLAGGVAQNCVTNGSLVNRGVFESIWVQPCPGDAGGALGAALARQAQNQKWRASKRSKVCSDYMNGAQLGPSFSNDEIRDALEKYDLTYTRNSRDSLYSTVARLLSSGLCVGWFQGRMEFGPRALGNRSIIADPRQRGMQKKLNRKIKFREDFRPFAPSIIADYVEEWFDQRIDSPFMSFVMKFKSSRSQHEDIRTDNDELVFADSNSTVPAVTHVDGSARLQTVDQHTFPVFYALLSAFLKETGCPMLLNTSFNVRGEPIVCTPRDAIECFLGTHMDVLVMEDFIITKRSTDLIPDEQFRNSFFPD